MYHIEKDHEAIIPPATFQHVQDEMERRRSVPHSGDTILSGKIICGDCGKSYGPKVWHSNDKYRKVVWQCNHKYQGDRTCTTPHVYEAGIKEAFIQVCNKLSGGRDEILGNLRDIQTKIGETETLGQQKVILLQERDHYAELLQDLIDRNARVTQDQKAYAEQYDALYEQNAAAEKELRKLEKSIHSEEMRQRRSNKYSPTLRNQRLLHCVQLPFVLLHLCAFDKQKAATSLSAYESGACHTPDHPNRRPAALPAAGLHPSPPCRNSVPIGIVKIYS